VEPQVYRVILSSDVPTRGGELSLAWNGDVLTLAEVSEGPGFPEGVPVLYIDDEPADQCPLSDGVSAGATVGWIYSDIGVLELPAGSHEILTVRFDRVEGAPDDACSPLRFLRCLGASESPVQNTVTDREGRSLAAVTIDRTTCEATCRVLEIEGVAEPGCDEVTVEVRDELGGSVLVSTTVEVRGRSGLDLVDGIVNALVSEELSDVVVGKSERGVSLCRPSGAGFAVRVSDVTVEAGAVQTVCGFTFKNGAPSIPDTDLDGVQDPIDGCPLAYDPLQRDTDLDGLGDECDPDPMTPSSCRILKIAPLDPTSCAEVELELRELDGSTPIPGAAWTATLAEASAGRDFAASLCGVTAGHSVENVSVRCTARGLVVCRQDSSGEPLGFRVFAGGKEVRASLVETACGLRIWLEEPGSPDLDGDGVGDRVDNCPETANSSQRDANDNDRGDACEIVQFRRGDSNTDGEWNLTDAVHVLGYLFLGKAPPECLDASDVEDDGRITINDPIYLLNHLFLGGPQPPLPGPTCGRDETDDPLGCWRYDPCL
jgi:hypothetical protein